MAEKDAEFRNRIAALPLWRGRIEIAPLSGGITNRNFLVAATDGRYVVRLGEDIPVHGIMRFNEQAASRAAAAAGISPEVAHAAPGLLVIRFIEGRTLTPAEIRADRERCVELVRRAHREVARHLRGPILAFNVFHILRDYAATLNEVGSRAMPRLGEWLAIADRLERASGAAELVLGHNDLLAGNFIDDGSRLWLIDWDYAGFNTPLFDLGGLSSNNGFDEIEERAMLEAYFERPVADSLLLRFRAMQCASLLRETMWSLVSEHHSALEFDYHTYSEDNLARFQAAWRGVEEMIRS